MKDTLILQDKIYISAKRVHEIFGYTSDYVGQLCRAGKLEARMVGRSWFVTEKSVADHKVQSLKVLNPRIASEEKKMLAFQSAKMSILSLVCAVLLLSFVYTHASSQTGMLASFGSVSTEVYEVLKNLIFRKAPETVAVSSHDFNGMVVVPSTGSAVADDALEQKIRDSFSDEVVVTVDEDGRSGIVTPVFKETKGEDFLYVLVPAPKEP